MSMLGPGSEPYPISLEKPCPHELSSQHLAALATYSFAPTLVAASRAASLCLHPTKALYLFLKIEEDPQV